MGPPRLPLGGMHPPGNGGHDLAAVKAMSGAAQARASSRTATQRSAVRHLAPAKTMGPETASGEDASSLARGGHDLAAMKAAAPERASSGTTTPRSVVRHLAPANRGPRDCLWGGRILPGIGVHDLAAMRKGT
ncbi:hypothetical protein PG996_008486 [Apiospora saccharicola]|uniref:Uncharacterized protein n=1 Tax=Apiospora saccharicola TaxID=335842 RepID=A0ABR1UY20_9PEZI